MEFILVLFAVPALAWGISLLLDRALPGRTGCPSLFLVPPLVGGLAVFLAWTIAGLSAGGPADPLVTIVLFVLIAVILAAAIVTPIPILDQTFPGKPRTMILFAAAALTIPFLLALLVNPESWEGGPLPLLADRLPILGGIFDTIMTFTPLEAASGFEPVFSAFLYAGIYLEIALVSAVLFFLIRLIANRFFTQENREGPEG